MTPFAWAGLILDTPDSYRPLKIDGVSYNGRVILADDERARLEITWATNASRRFKADKFIRRRALSGLARIDRKQAMGDLVDVEHPHFQPMVRYDDDAANVTRWVGYCGKTKRAVDVIYQRGAAAEDARMRDSVLPSLRDQPLDEPQRWALYGFHFTVPANMRYVDSNLNLGDMRLTFRGPRKAKLVLRELHPAKLALTRQKLGKWLEDVAKKERYEYPPPPAKKIEPVECAAGEAVGFDAKLRPGRKLFMWRSPWRLRWRMIHDADHNRLIALGVAARKAEIDPLIDAVLDGLHWQ